MYAGTVAADRGDDEAADSYQAEALALARQEGDRYVEGFALAQLGVVAWGRGELAEVTAHLETALAVGRMAGHPLPTWVALTHLAHMACDRGESAKAAAYYRNFTFMIAGNDRQGMARLTPASQSLPSPVERRSGRHGALGRPRRGGPRSAWPWRCRNGGRPSGRWRRHGLR